VSSDFSGCKFSYGKISIGKVMSGNVRLVHDFSGAFRIGQDISD
jgi:hypothetical protein